MKDLSRSLILSLLAATLLAGAAAATTPPAPRATDAELIEATVAAVGDAWNGRDAAALARLFSDDAEVVDASGGAWRGRDAIVAGAGAILATEPPPVRTLDVRVQFVSDGVAVARTHWMIDAAAGRDARTERMTHVLAKKNGAWRIVSTAAAADGLAHASR